MSTTESDKNTVVPKITLSNPSLNKDTINTDAGILDSGATRLDAEFDDTDYDTALNDDEDDEGTPITSSELDCKIQALIEALQELEEYEKLITNRCQSRAEENVEKRKIRCKQRKINDQLKQCCFRREMQKAKTNVITPRKKPKASETQFKIPQTMIAKLTLDESKETDYYRLLKIADSYREKITTLYNELDDKLDEIDGALSEYDREEKKLEINTKIETMKSLLQEYQKEITKCH